MWEQSEDMMSAIRMPYESGDSLKLHLREIFHTPLLTAEDKLALSAWLKKAWAITV